MLKKLLQETDLTNWEVFIPFIQYYINGRISEFVGSSPWSLMFGRAQNPLSDYRDTAIDWSADNHAEMATKLNQRWADMFSIILPSIAERATHKQQQAKETFAKTHHITQFKLGDRVMYLDPNYAGGSNKTTV